MWTRKELKKKGKAAFMLNYWKTVLVGLILVVLIGGAGGSVAGFANRGGSAKHNESSVETTVTESNADTFGEFQDNMAEHGLSPEAIAVLAVIAVLIGLMGIGFTLAIRAFLINPFEIGTRRFFTRNLNQPARVGEVAFAFDNNYLNIVKTDFLKDLYTILWTMLFIIPGIIKAYEYRMIPYILADHPEMPTKEVFAKSKALMKGQKWRAFVLDLSFIGWEILSLITVRILGFLYVTPYRCMTNAALYERLEYGNLVEENN